MNRPPAGADRRVRVATKADVSELAEVMANAFFDEPQFVWLQPEDALRRRLLPAMFRLMLRCLYPIDRDGQVIADDRAVLGGAVWTPPGRWTVPVWQQLRGVPGLLVALGGRNLRSYANRGRALQQALERAHPDERHRYLVGLGVAPAAQGRGLGTALMHAGLDRCDREGVPAYLECLERLVPYYEGFGFQARGEIRMPESAPPQVGMWRSRP